eukprot:Pgem_evm1s9329
MLRLNSLADYEALPTNKWNIKQLNDNDALLKAEALEIMLNSKNEAEIVNNKLDLIIVPGLGFGEGGARLGRGKGYYDKYLAEANAIIGKHLKEHLNDLKYDGDHHVKTVGLCFSVQWCSLEIPMESHDLHMHYLVTPDEVK